MATSGEDKARVDAALANADIVISHLRKLGPPFQTSLQFADTMTKALQEWIPTDPATTGECRMEAPTASVPATNLAGGDFLLDASSAITPGPLNDFLNLLDSGPTFAAEQWGLSDESPVI